MVTAFDSGPTNPSSVHGYGRAARKLIEDARAQVAALVGAAPAQVVFNSGATEGNNTVLDFYGRSSGGENNRILISSIEHSSIIEPGRAMGLEAIPVTPDGVVDLAALEAMIKVGPAPVLISVMMVNNETGVIQPIDDVVALARSCGAAVHVDAVQALGKIQVDAKLIGADIMTVSSHKIGGPQGVGAMILADASTAACRPPPVLMRGGGQERSLRPGTENVAGIVGFGAAAGEVLHDMVGACAPSPSQGEGRGGGQPQDHLPQSLSLTLPLRGGGDYITLLHDFRTQIETRLKTIRPDTVIFGENAPRVPNTVCFAVPGFEAQTLLMQLDLAGIAVSSGSACSSGKVRESHVLRAMGVAPELARGALRVSAGWSTDDDAIDRFIEVWQKIVTK
jgi:cysteine desulfurase